MDTAVMDYRSQLATACYGSLILLYMLLILVGACHTVYTVADALAHVTVDHVIDVID